MQSVRLKSDGCKTVISASDGSPLQGVCRAVWEADAAGTTLQLQFEVIETQLDAKPQFLVADPRTGELKEIAKITFADGAVFDVTDI